MKKQTLIYSAIALAFGLIGLSYIYPSEILNQVTIIYFSIFFAVAIFYMILVPIYNFFFVVNEGKYWIRKGKHYADGFNISWLPNIKIFFFKKSIEFEYRISPDALQDDNWQINKIFGISNIIPRKDSGRIGFSSWFIFKEEGDIVFTNYFYENGKRIIEEGFEEPVPKDFIHMELELENRAWFGYVHFPYHGGKIPSQKHYWIEIRNVKLK